MDVVGSVNGVSIRLTDERWAHILSNHPEVGRYRSELLDTVGEPDVVIRSRNGSLLAVRRLTDALNIVVLYREVSQQDGFIITSWLTSHVERVLKGEVLWRRKS